MYLSEDLITSVKRRANVPTSQNTFQTADFLALADEEIRSKLVPLVLKHMEEFYVTYKDYSLVVNQNIYAIPYRAIAMSLRDVLLLSSTNADTRVGLERLSPEDLYLKTGFYIQGNSIILYPTPRQTPLDTLRMPYCMRPNSLVSTSACALITAINSGSNQVTVSAVPSNITTMTLVDFVRAIPGFECTAIDQTITNIGGTTLTFSASLPTNLQVGDYVCQAGFSNVVQVPVELQPLLFQYIVVRILAAQGDQANLKAAIAELDSLETAAGVLLAPRVAGKVKRVVKARGIKQWV